MYMYVCGPASDPVKVHGSRRADSGETQGSWPQWAGSVHVLIVIRASTVVCM